MKREVTFPKQMVSSHPKIHLMQKFREERHGSIAVLFAVMLSLLCLSVGIAVDGWRRTAVQTRLQEIADAAILAGTKHAQDIQDGSRGKWKKEAERVASKFFKAQIAELSDVSMDPPAFEFTRLSLPPKFGPRFGVGF